MPATKPPTTLDEIRALNPAYVINRQGKDHVLYAGLLDYAHLHGLKRIGTTLLQAPSDANGQMAICAAEVETERGTFAGIGDADIGNAGKMIAPHRVRFAETRAKARALRDAYNVGGAAFEELGDDDDQPAARPTPQVAPTPQAATPQAAPDGPATEAQLKRIETLYRLLSIPLSLPKAMSAAGADRRIADHEQVARTTDASDSQWKGLMEQAGVARKATGYVHALPETMTIAEYERHMREVVKHQAKQPAAPEPPPSPAVPASAQPATPQQKERLAKLQASLGRQTDPAALAHLSFEAAAIAITEAVQAFNSKTPAQQAARQPAAAR